MIDYTFADLFAGAGGFGVGFQSAGVRGILSLERDKFACQTLTANFSHSVLHADIANYMLEDSIKKVVGSPPTFLIGGPPCQGFSIAASNRIKANDKRNNLPLAFLEWVKVLKPKFFVIENVPGILTKRNEHGRLVVRDIINYCRDINYNVSIWKLDASNYGVPQRRNRVFLVGSTDYSNLPEPPITHSGNKGLRYNAKITVGEAISDLPKIRAGEGSEILDYGVAPKNLYQEQLRLGSSNVYNHVAMNHTTRMIDRYKMLIDGSDNIPAELAVRERNGNGRLSSSTFNQNYRVLREDSVSYTIPASFYSSFVHPYIPRNVTAREAARLQSFPDWYQFKGKRTLISSKLLRRQGKEDQIGLSQYNQVGNAVPPLLAKAIAEHLLKYL